MSSKKRKQIYVPKQTLNNYFTAEHTIKQNNQLIDLTQSIKPVYKESQLFKPASLPVTQRIEQPTEYNHTLKKQYNNNGTTDLNVAGNTLQFTNLQSNTVPQHNLPPNTTVLINKQTKLTFTQSVKPIQYWYEHNQSILYYIHSQSKPSTKLACFDLDQTLIHIKSGNRYPADRYDWRLAFSGNLIRNRLHKLYNDGYRIIIFTNQAGIGLGKQNKFDITDKISDVIIHLGVPIDCYAATQYDMNRKGNIGMFEFMLQYYNGQYNTFNSIDRRHSFYVGDAAGRCAGWHPQAPKRHDRSCTDRKFAYNAGIQFYTPEEYFLNQPKAVFDWGIEIPYAEIPQHTLCPTVLQQLRSPIQEMVIMVAIQGAGKTTFVHTHYIPYGYTHINQDILQTRQQCISCTIDALQQGHSVVIDRINSTIEQRKYFIDIAKQYNIYVKVVELKTSLGIARRLNAMRSILGSEYQLNKPIVPDPAFYQYSAIYQQPDPIVEQFDQYIEIPFCPQLKTEKEIEIFDTVQLK